MKKKVLMFINSYGSTSETFISDEIEFLSSQKDVDVTILHYGKDIPEKKVVGLYFESNFTKRWLQALRKFDVKMFATLQYKNGLNGSLVSLIPFLRKNKFDTIYCHFGTNGKLIAELKELKVIPKESKLVVRFHGLDMNMKKYGKSFYNILRNYSEAILYGTKMAEKKLNYYGFKDQLINLPVGIKRNNIVAVESIRKESQVDEIFKILSVGRFIELKGHHIALEIINKISNENLVLEIIGDGPLLKGIENEIFLKKLKTKILLLGSKPHHEVFSKLNDCHVYLYSGVYDAEGRCENQATSVLEAMARGCVVLASGLGGITDYLFDRENGFVAEPGNVNQFVGKLQWIMQNYTSDEIVQMRQNAITMVKENYCQEKLNEKLLSLLID